MLTSLLQKIKDRMLLSSCEGKGEDSQRQSQSATDSSTPRSTKTKSQRVPSPEDEILTYLDTHGILDKDVQGPASVGDSQQRSGESSLGESLSSTSHSALDKTTSEPSSPPTAYLEKRRISTDSATTDLSIFDDDDNSDEAREILDFVDAHGTETKKSDSFVEKRSKGEITRSKKAHEFTIDLHGLTKEGAQRRIARAFKEAKTQGAGQLLIIHGRGNHNAQGRSPLKEMVYELLASQYQSKVRSYGFAPPSEGGGGATRVVLM